MSTLKIGGVMLLALGGVTVWAFSSPLIAKWMVLGMFVLNFLSYLGMKEKK